MTVNPVGISDLALYVPDPVIELKTLLARRAAEDATLARRLQRAIETTGQQAIRYPRPWEDNATLSAQAAHSLLQRNSSDALAGLRYLAVGTETGVDHSKPVAAYVEGMLQQAGLPVPESMSTFQVQHACAGGTISMLSVGALLQACGRDDESGVVICSDIARYESRTTAEITQGAGAVAMLIEPNPALIELDLRTQGYSSRDVDDFFRPLGSVTARVRGGYSVQCYNDAFEHAFLDHCRRVGRSPHQVLRETDVFALHVPFYKMAITALHRLVTRHMELDGEQFESFMRERGFLQGIDVAARIGNIYSGAAYVALMFSLADRYRTFGDGIVGKRVLIGSYGSGNTMTVVAGRITESAPRVIERWNLDLIWKDEAELPFADYETWMGAPYPVERYRALVDPALIPERRYYLADIRDDGYREYRFKQ
ncbi:MAG: hypothetical protein EA384_10840 [Spirochaetaceae bacterium]|nr:MAG: hypothetical protein EA384_10840 [Spirochaetaceae bacterium]